MARVGVLALQGGFGLHASALRAIGDEPREVRDASDLAALDGLVLPGGESTAMLTLIERFALAAALDELVHSGIPILATCAGLILAAREVTHPAQRSFSWLDVAVSRNGWGRQLDSFEALADDGTTPLVFIRAPRIVSVGAETEVLATFRGEPVMVRQNNVVGATFHPELVDGRLHHTVFHG
jgi:5'-phosphate synthase pdxT subunit